MNRFTRLAALIASTLALAGATMPPASAFTVIDTAFVGRLTVVGGIGFPTLTNLPTPSVPTIDCLDPLPDGNPVPNCHTHYRDYVRNAHLGSTTCVEGTTNVAKWNKAPAHAGACGVTGDGHVSGHCGLNGGQMTGTYVDSLGQVYSFSAHFAEAGVWTVTGHVQKQADPSQNGKITGTATAAEVIKRGGGTCLTKTQTEFILSGQFTITMD